MVVSSASVLPTRLSAMKLVVVSGASRGLGLGFASQLLRRAPQSTIVAASRSGTSDGLERLMSEYPGRILPVACDVTEQASTRALTEQLKADLGGAKVDLLLNVAGKLHGGQSSAAAETLPSEYMPERSLGSIDATAMQSVFATNALGPVLMAQAIAPLLAKGGASPCCARLSGRFPEPYGTRVV